MKHEPKKCPTCNFTIGHADDCEYRSPATLSETEERYWRTGFVHGDGDPAAGDRMLRKYWAHLDSDVQSLLKDPSLEEVACTGTATDVFASSNLVISIGDESIAVRVEPYSSAEAIVDAINKELLKRDLNPVAGEPG